MTKEETKERIKVMQAYIDGKEIEVQSLSGAWFLTTNPAWSPDNKYRIKTEYRPFKNDEECWNEMQKHLPFGWIKDKDERFYSITKIDRDGCCSGDDDDAYGFLFKFRKFLDGTPFGIKE
nr:MAG TPA: hypothetical protein [Caudoviricetes sp.]